MMTSHAEIIKLYEQGLSVTQIARQLSVKAPYVYNVLEDYLKEKDNKQASTTSTVNGYYPKRPGYDIEYFVPMNKPKGIMKEPTQGRKETHNEK